jgi:hypothetical protein
MKHINYFSLNIPSIILINLLLIIIISLNPAKKAKGQNFNGGVMIGLVGSQVAGDRFSGFNKAGLTGGGWVSLQVAPTTQYQMELSYIQKGSRENPDYEKEKYDFYRMQLGYVELALLYRRLVGEKLYLEAGPAMNFLLHHHEKYNSEELFSPFAKRNFCLILGLSYRIGERTVVNFRTNNSIFTIRTERVNGDVWRFFDHGQFNDALVFSLYYEL